MARYFHALPIALAAFLPMPSTAQSATDATGVIRLSDEQRDRILDTNTEDSAAAARGELTGAERAERRIHGEVGVMVGTNGMRAAYGIADIPLGDKGNATVAVSSSRYGYRR